MSFKILELDIPLIFENNRTKFCDVDEKDKDEIIFCFEMLVSRETILNEMQEFLHDTLNRHIVIDILNRPRIYFNIGNRDFTKMKGGMEFNAFIDLKEDYQTTKVLTELSRYILDFIYTRVSNFTCFLDNGTIVSFDLNKALKGK